VQPEEGSLYVDSESKSQSRRLAQNMEVGGCQPLIARLKGNFCNAFLPVDNAATLYFDSKSSIPSPFRSSSFDVLPEVIIAIILSFLFEGMNTKWEDAIHDLRSITSVSKSIRKVLITSVLPEMRICMNMVSCTCPSKTFHTILLLSKHRVKLQGFHVNGGYNDFDLLAAILSISFQSDSIEDLTLNLPARPVPSRYIQPTSCKIEDYMKIPPEFSRLSVTGFIALPMFRSLVRLKISILINPMVWDDAHDALFSIPKLKHFDLKLSFISKARTSTSPGLYHLSERLSRMRNLEELTLRASGVNSHRIPYLFSTNFKIYSLSLCRISLFHLPNGFYLRYCVCPNLEILECRNGIHGNGVRPSDPLLQESRDISIPGDEFVVGQYPFFGMVVPPTCIVKFGID
jgi:hypothetical protein